MVIWIVSKRGNFSVKSLNSVLEPNDLLLFSWSIIWSSCMPPKVAFFAWKATWGKALSLDQVQRRFSLANNFFPCHFEEETVDHILLHYAKIRILWQLLFTLFGVSWVLSFSVKRHSLGGIGLLWVKFAKSPGRLPQCIFWTVWKERNMLAFDNAEFSVQRIKNSFIHNLWSWSRVSVDVDPTSLFSFIDWLGSK